MLYNRYTTPTQRVKQVLPCTPKGDASNGSDDWILLEVKNTTAERALAALFDSSGKFLFKEGVQTQAGVTIRMLNGSYEALMNDIASTEQYCTDLVRVEVTNGDILQLDNPWLIKEDKRFSNSSNTVTEIFPGTYKDPYQQQANRVDVRTGFTITRQRVWEVQMEGETTMVLRIHLSKEVLNG